MNHRHKGKSEQLIVMQKKKEFCCIGIVSVLGFVVLLDFSSSFVPCLIANLFTRVTAEDNAVPISFKEEQQKLQKFKVKPVLC